MGAQACNENYEQRDKAQTQYTSHFKELWKEQWSRFAETRTVPMHKTKVCTDMYRKRNGKELRCLPLTLAFIKAVKTTRMSGSPSPFTSHSSSGDNTPPATITENHPTVVKKATQPIFHAGRGGPAQKKRLMDSQASRSLLGNHQCQAAHTTARCFTAWKGRNVASGSGKWKGKMEEVTGKHFCIPFHFLRWCGSHISYEGLHLEASGRMQGGRDISRRGRNYFTNHCYFTAEVRIGDTLEMLPVAWIGWQKITNVDLWIQAGQEDKRNKVS